MSSPTHPLRLAVGSHQAGSGKGCAMNVIAWENGDTTITDLPACSDPLLARIVQRVNDVICTHRDGDLLCPSCSLQMLDLAHRTVGTSAHGLAGIELRRVYVRVAADQARAVQHLNTDPRVETSIAAAERWADAPTEANRSNAAAYAAANAAANAAAADAANAANAAAAAYAAANAAANAATYAAANAANAATYAAANAANANAAWAAAWPGLAHRAIDTFLKYVTVTTPDIPADVTETAIAQMLTSR